MEWEQRGGEGRKVGDRRRREQEPCKAPVQRFKVKMRPGCFNSGISTFVPQKKLLLRVGVEGLFPVEAVRAARSQDRGTWLGSLPKRASGTIWMHQMEKCGLDSGAQWWGRGTWGVSPYPLPRVQMLVQVTSVIGSMVAREKRPISAPIICVTLGGPLSSLRASVSSSGKWSQYP